jgi:hypothetical protein
MKDMIRDTVIVFQIAGEGPLINFPFDYDLLASPQDLAVTWNPARFITDLSGINFYAIEIGGGTINFPQPLLRRCIGVLGSIITANTVQLLIGTRRF